MNRIAFVGKVPIQSHPIVACCLHTEGHNLGIGPKPAPKRPQKPVSTGTVVGYRHGENLLAGSIEDAHFVLSLGNIDAAKVHPNSPSG